VGPSRSGGRGGRTLAQEQTKRIREHDRLLPIRSEDGCADTSSLVGSRTHRPSACPAGASSFVVRFHHDHLAAKSPSLLSGLTDCEMKLGGTDAQALEPQANDERRF